MHCFKAEITAAVDQLTGVRSFPFYLSLRVTNYELFCIYI